MGALEIHAPAVMCMLNLTLGGQRVDRSCLPTLWGLTGVFLRLMKGLGILGRHSEILKLKNVTTMPMLLESRTGVNLLVLVFSADRFDAS